MKLNAKINVTFQSIMTEKISDKHLLECFFGKDFLCSSPMHVCICLFVIKDLNMTLSE